MKTNILFLLIFLIAEFSVKAQTVSMYILELENHTKWEAVDSKWKSQRDQWVADCKAETAPQKSAQLLLQFESNIKWEAVEDDWAKLRNDWVNECKQANSSGQVVRSLKELEANIKWSAVDEIWKTRRSEWINELNVLQASTASPSKPMEAQSLFHSVTIGNQVWMAENLNVEKFRNGDPIRQVKTQKEWEEVKNNQEPAWWYGTNSVKDYGTTYGKLYNWYAVNDPRGLAPEGWHIPSDIEWEELFTFLTKTKASYSKLKSQDGWINDKNGTNDFGFSALPGGNSEQDICFNVGQQAVWWSTKEELDKFAIVWILTENDFMQPDAKFKYGGCSVRCIKNK